MPSALQQASEKEAYCGTDSLKISLEYVSKELWCCTEHLTTHPQNTKEAINENVAGVLCRSPDGLQNRADSSQVFGEFWESFALYVRLGLISNLITAFCRQADL